MGALEPPNKAKQETKYVQLVESERRRLAAPMSLEDAKRRTDQASMVRMLYLFSHSQCC